MCKLKCGRHCRSHAQLIHGPCFPVELTQCIYAKLIHDPKKHDKEKGARLIPCTFNESSGPPGTLSFFDFV